MRNRDTRKIIIAILLTAGSISILHAQNAAQTLKDAANSATIAKDPNDTTKMTWKTGGLFNLTFNQAALSNWSAGGENSAISLSTLLNLYAFYADGRRSWDRS